MGVQISGDTGNVLATKGTYTGNLTIGGVLTYEDVTNVDSIGIVTARAGVLVGSGITLSKDGDIFATGVSTSTKVHVGVDTGVYGEDLVVTGNSRVTGITTFGDSDNPALMLNIDATSGLPAISIPHSIIHSGDTDTKISFPAADTITAETGGSERIRIDSNGYAGIGANDPHLYYSKTLVVNAGDGEGDGGGITIKGGSTHTNYLMFADSNSGAARYDGYVGYSHGSQRLDLATAGAARANIDSSGNLTIGNGNLVIGTSGKGIDFSATADSSGSMDNELFDDYEEGLFTPTIGSQYGSPSVSYQGSDNRRGRYVKVGKMVHVNCLVGWQGVTGSPSGNLRIGGLPFAHENVEHADPNDYTQSVGACYFQNLTLPFTNNGHTVVYIWGGYSTYVTLIQSNNNDSLAQVAINSGNNAASGTIKYVQFSLTYPAA